MRINNSIIYLGAFLAFTPFTGFADQQCNILCDEKFESADLVNACIFGCSSTDSISPEFKTSIFVPATVPEPETNPEPEPNPCGSEDGTMIDKECPTPVSWEAVFKLAAENVCIATGECALFFSDEWVPKVMKDTSLKEVTTEKDLFLKSLQVDADSGMLIAPRGSFVDFSGISIGGLKK